MTLPDFLARLRDALRQEEPTRHQDYGAEQRREEREQTALNLQKAEVGERRTERNQEHRYRKITLGLAWVTFIVSFLTMVAVGYYAAVAKWQLDKTAEILDE